MGINIKKSLLVFAAIILSSLCLISCGSTREFDQFKESQDIDVMHLPKVATWMVSTLAGDKLAKSVIRGAGSIDIIDCQGEKNKEKVLAAVDEAVANSNSELVIEVTEAKEIVRIYGRPDGKKNKIRNVIIVSDEPKELSVVRLNGAINFDAIIKETLKEPLRRK